MEDKRFPLFWAFFLGVFVFLSEVCAQGVFVGKGFSASRYSVVDRDLILSAADVARMDDVPSRWCGRGTLSVLSSLGLADGLRGADGHDWEESLWEAGWRPVPCSDPSLAPYGSVLVYDSDWRLIGRNERGTPGGRWGHVEFVAWDEKVGGRVYVSDAPRRTPGGTVLDNFTHRAWVPPSFVKLFRRLHKRDLPFSGYVYRGRKDDNPGTRFLRGEVQLESGLGRGDAGQDRDVEALPLGSGELGSNPLFGVSLGDERGSGFSSEVEFEDMGGFFDGGGVSMGEGLSAAPGVVEPYEVVKERLDLLLAFRKAEAARFFGGGR